MSYLPAQPKKAPKTGEVRNCDACAAIQLQGERPACVAACPMRAIEYGDIDELRARHEGARISDDFPVLSDIGPVFPESIYLIKESMRSDDYDEVKM